MGKSRMHNTARVALFRGVGQPFEVSGQPIVTFQAKKMCWFESRWRQFAGRICTLSRDGDPFRCRVRWVMKLSE